MIIFSSEKIIDAREMYCKWDNVKHVSEEVKLIQFQEKHMIQIVGTEYKKRNE